ncbi:hypothetical protein BESB_046840 [Besnoitia besnoiti]|uniref:Breast carcinoma amplified sequence protein 2 n=1 Tax=Besnoitia besnoiti TaxID=94643 RepID=A0A2A9MLY3_BESBE|nr:hypothetical protein BESB_046840 [Besnoitia besnoiti]PFH36492.1 hypothetical protein BESB_046840 [Besnoitia besnoiti]
MPVLGVHRAPPSTALVARTQGPAASPSENGQDLDSPASAPQFLSQRLPYAHLVDTLPYVDALTPEQNEEAKSLLQQELVLMNRERRAKRQDLPSGVAEEEASSLEADILKEYLDELLPPPKTPHLDNPNTLVGKELLRIKRGEPMQKLDLSRLYEAAPAPPKSAETAEWRKSIATCESLLEHLGLGQTNLDLMNVHAISTWTRHLQNLMLQGNHWESALKRVRTDVDGVSKARKLEQVECGNVLRNLNRTKEDYEERNREILVALQHLNGEVADLKHKCRTRGLLPEDYDSDPEEEGAAWAVPVPSSAPELSCANLPLPASEAPVGNGVAQSSEDAMKSEGSSGVAVGASAAAHLHAHREEEMVDYDDA